MAGPTSVSVQTQTIKLQTDCPFTEIFSRGTIALLIFFVYLILLEIKTHTKIAKKNNSIIKFTGRRLEVFFWGLYFLWYSVYLMKIILNVLFMWGGG